MEKVKKILPQNFVTVNGINYFRLEDGRIAVESINNVTIDASNEDIVELITLECKSKEVKLWKVSDKIYALASSSYVTIPQDTTFVDFYFSTHYTEGVYVKYISSGNCGILYVSETDVSMVISHEKYYTEICFENGLFYANAKDGDNKYHVIGESGKQLGVYPSKCKKLEGYMLFYDESKIFIDSTEFEISDGIISVEVINKHEITFVKVVNSKGIYYYTKDISYLLGPIQKEEIISIDKKICYIHEIINGKIIKVFYIGFEANAYICKSISCDKGINVYPIGTPDMKLRFFSTKDKALYVFQEDFILLIKDVDADTFTFNRISSWYSDYNIVAFKKKKPIYWASYNTGKNQITDSSTLDIIDSGFQDDTNICKKGNTILVINERGQILFSTTGKTCYKRMVRFKDSWRTTSVYIVDQDNNKIELYTSKGERI